MSKKNEIIDVEAKVIDENQNTEQEETKKEKGSVKKFFGEKIVPVGKKACTVIGGVVVAGASAVAIGFVGSKILNAVGGTGSAMDGFSDFGSDEDDDCDDSNFNETSDDIKITDF